LVRLTVIYTRGGDSGETSLGDGARVPKDDTRVTAFGTVDEANAAIGLALLAAEPEIASVLTRIQNDLFDVGADLCTPGEGGDGKLRMTDGQTAWLEAQIDAVNARLKPLDSFILPGGSEASARLHVARTVVRRAERWVVRLGRSETINPAVLRYLNRLSDLLFVLARAANRDGFADILWIPGANR
jgi:cob(I)alamin adenosyltransferase